MLAHDTVILSVEFPGGTGILPVRRCPVMIDVSRFPHGYAPDARTAAAPEQPLRMLSGRSLTCGRRPGACSITLEHRSGLSPQRRGCEAGRNPDPTHEGSNFAAWRTNPFDPRQCAQPACSDLLSLFLSIRQAAFVGNSEDSAFARVLWFCPCIKSSDAGIKVIIRSAWSARICIIRESAVRITG